MAANEPLKKIALTIPPKAEYLVFCRLVLAGIARARVLDQEVLGDMKLAVTEACSNVIRHAYRDGREGDVSVRYLMGEDHLTVEVVDDGRGFDPDQERDSILDELAEDGMGIAIIRAIVDELEVGPGPEGRGSRLRFTKYFR